MAIWSIIQNIAYSFIKAGIHQKLPETVLYKKKNKSLQCVVYIRKETPTWFLYLYLQFVNSFVSLNVYKHLDSSLFIVKEKKQKTYL
jgi:hypothetical protein